MSELIKIAVDAMGGDGSPKKIIDGIIQNHKKNKENYFIIPTPYFTSPIENQGLDALMNLALARMMPSGCQDKKNGKD